MHRHQSNFTNQASNVLYEKHKNNNDNSNNKELDPEAHVTCCIELFNSVVCYLAASMLKLFLSPSFPFTISTF